MSGILSGARSARPSKNPGVFSPWPLDPERLHGRRVVRNYFILSVQFSSIVSSWTRYRLRSVLVARQGTPIRAYRLTYGMSGVTSRSILAALQQFGTDVAIDAAGLITGGMSLPARSFTYQGDPLAGSLRPWPAQ
jgi:hypothetical protein